MGKAIFLMLLLLVAGSSAMAEWIYDGESDWIYVGFKDYQGRYVFNPASAPGMQDTLLGYPIFEAEDMPTYSTVSALGIAFGNFKRGYLIADRIGTRVLRDPFSSKPNVMFYVTKRLGACVLNSECIKLLRFA